MEKNLEKAQRELNFGKLETLKADADEASRKFYTCQDAYATDMFSVLSREREYVEKLAHLMKIQIAYHKQAATSLESLLPQLEKRMSQCFPPYHTLSSPLSPFSPSILSGSGGQQDIVRYINVHYVAISCSILFTPEPCLSVSTADLMYCISSHSYVHTYMHTYTHTHIHTHTHTHTHTHKHTHTHTHTHTYQMKLKNAQSSGAHWKSTSRCAGRT